MKPIAYIMIAALALASCGEEKKDPKTELIELKKERAKLDDKIAKLEANNVDTTKKTPVSVQLMQPEVFNAFIEVQSSVIGDQNVYALPQMTGMVTAVLVKAGDHVSKGQTLATLDAAAVEQQIKAQEAQVALAKSVYEKQERLWKQNIGSEVQYMQAKTQYEAGRRGLDATVAQRNMFKIIAPISGVVDVVDAKVGQPAGAMGNTPIGIRVVNNSQLKAQAALGENYLGKVHSGDPVTLVFADINDSIKTKISYVAQAVDPVSRAFQVEVRLGANKILHPNMSCLMKIANYESNTALVLPVSVIQKTAGGEMVYVVNGNKARSTIIKTGRNSNGRVEVLEGLKQGDKVVVEGYREVDNGETVTIQ